MEHKLPYLCSGGSGQMKSTSFSLNISGYQHRSSCFIRICVVLDVFYRLDSNRCLIPRGKFVEFSSIVIVVEDLSNKLHNYYIVGNKLSYG